jgi:hypothetical protein
MAEYQIIRQEGVTQEASSAPVIAIALRDEGEDPNLEKEANDGKKEEDYTG